MGGVADTRPSAFHDDTLHPPPSQRKDVYHVDVHVQVSSGICLPPRVARFTIVYPFFDSHSSFVHLLFNCMALTSFGMLNIPWPAIL